MYHSVRVRVRSRVRNRVRVRVRVTSSIGARNGVWFNARHSLPQMLPLRAGIVTRVRVKVRVTIRYGSPDDRQVRVWVRIRIIDKSSPGYLQLAPRERPSLAGNPISHNNLQLRIHLWFWSRLRLACQPEGDGC